MPERKGVRRVVSVQVQGEDSWVEFLRPKGGFARELLELSEVESTAVDRWNMNSALLVKYVHAWNWVDDDGDPLPQLKEKPDILDDLTVEEIEWLGRNIMERAEQGN